MELQDLEPADRRYLEQVHIALEKLGAKPVAAAKQEEIEWVTRFFPHWRRKDLYPFFLSEKGIVPLNVPGFEANFVMALFPPEEAQDFDKHHTHLACRKGMLLLGYDRGGNWILIDTKSDSGLDIVMIAAGYIEDQEIDPECFIRTGNSILNFLEGILADPMGFLEVWDRHNSDL